MRGGLENYHVDPYSGGGLSWAPGSLGPSTRYQGVEAFLQSLEFVFTKKLRFTGKGYKIKKSLAGRGARLTFGHSHRLDSVFASCKVIRLAKQKFLLFSNRQSDLFRDSQKAGRARLLSPYTKRGLRLSRAPVLKRPGKKSSY